MPITGTQGGGDRAGGPPVTVDVYGLTDPGRVRTLNEDQFVVASMHKSMWVHQTSLPNLQRLTNRHASNGHLLVVADGVGGIGGGELASGTAVQALAEHIGEAVGCAYDFDVDREHEFLSQLEDAVNRAHERVRAEHSGTSGGPATTLTMVLLVWPRAYVVHVGDSRAYHLRAGRLRQLTRDQTAYEDLVDQGVMSEEEARRAGLKNMLTSALGATIRPSIGLIDLEPGDALVLCTDGLTKHVGDDEIGAIVGAGPHAEACCTALVERTLERGAKDNVTVIVGRFTAP